jgi:hypothetical protein
VPRLNSGPVWIPLMKKNDILRVRVDAVTLSALKHACEASGMNLSDIIREAIARELDRRGGVVKALGKQDEFGEALDTCARLLSSIIISQQSHVKENSERKEFKRRRVSRLLEGLFRAIFPQATSITLVRGDGPKGSSEQAWSPELTCLFSGDGRETSDAEGDVDRTLSSISARSRDVAEATGRIR